MSSSTTVHLPTDAIPSGADASRGQEPPVVLIAFAKLVLLVGTAVFLVPVWLALVGDAASGPVQDSWAALRLLVVGGSVVVFALLLTAAKVWLGLLKHLARLN